MSDTIVEGVISNGATTLAEVTRRCGAGQHCIACREEILDLIARARCNYGSSAAEIVAD